MKLQSVAETFAAYRNRVLPADASAVQVQETCRAFYAATWALLMALRDVIGSDEMSEDEGLEALEALKTECESYSRAGAPMPVLEPAAPTHERLYALAETYHPGSPDHLAVTRAAQTMKRIHEAPREFRASALVSQATGEGRLDIVWGGFVGQVEPVKAREIAWVLLEAASTAESEAAFMRFVRDRLGVSYENATRMLQDFRGHRDEYSSSLVGTKTDG